MGIADVVWMTLILGGAGYLMYRSVWKKKGHCQGCYNAGCSKSDLPPPCTFWQKAEYLETRLHSERPGTAGRKEGRP